MWHHLSYRARSFADIIYAHMMRLAIALGFVMCVAFNKYEIFAKNLCDKVHNLDTDQLNIALSNTAPNAATHTVRADITELATGGGYTQDTHDTTNTTSRSGGTASCVGVDVVITASGSVGPFRYAILYNTTAASDPLVGWWDYGSSISLSAGDSFTVDFGSSMFTVA